jgi:two-component system, NarL family, response regulator YdfI
LTRVLVAANSAVVRAGLETLVKSDPQRLALAGSSAVAGSLGRQVRQLRPDVVLVELSPGDPEFAAALQELQHLGDQPSPAIVVLAGKLGSQMLRFHGGAVLAGEATAREILAAIDAAAAGLFVLGREAAEVLLRNSAAGRSGASPLASAEPLTPREIEVLNLLAEGLANKEIANRLGISEHTIKFHVASILSKLGASSRTEAVTLGLRHGYIML